MALTIEVFYPGKEDYDNRELHRVSIQAIDPKSGEFEVELLDDDVEQEQMLAFMTGQRSSTLVAFEVLSRGLQGAFEYEDLTKLLLAGIRDDGIEALGMSKEGFAELVIDYVQFLIPKTGFYTGHIEWHRLDGSSGEVDADDFLALVDKLLPWFKKTRAFKRRVHDLALMAYLQETEGAGYLNFFHRLVEMTKKKLIHVAFQREEVVDEGAGHATKKIALGAYIGRSVVDEWEVVVDGWLCDYEMWEWCTQVDKDQSQGSSTTTDEFMRSAGHQMTYDDRTGQESIVRADEIVEAHAPKMPEEIRDNWNKNHGPYVILHEPYYVFGRFETQEEALKYYYAQADASDFTLRSPHAGMCGIFLRLIREVDAPDEPEEDSPEDKATMAGREEDWIDRNYDYDEHPGKIWEILDQQEI